MHRMAQRRLFVRQNILKRITYLAAASVLFFSFPPGPKSNATQELAQQPQPLEIQVLRPVQWVNGCLSVTVDRLNRSAAALYLPERGLYIASSAKVVRMNESEMTGEETWLPLYGPADMVSWDATPLAPGATQREEHCLLPSVAVVSMKRQTDRRVPVRGRLKILAYYFLSKEDWLESKSQHEEIHRIPPDQREKVSRVDPHSVMIEALIPCYGAGCSPGCDNPPLIFEDEKISVPYVPLKDWIARGRAIDEDLARKSPSCPQASSPP